MVATTQKTRSVLEAQVRESGSAKKTAHLRSGGKLPGIVYGLGGETISITLDAAATEHAVHSGAHLVDVKINGKIEHVLIQEVQYDHLQANIQHVDFLRIDPSRKVRVKVPLDFRGTPKGTKEGGILEVQTAEVEVEVLPLAIPDVIRVNVENLELHGILHVKEIAIPEGVRVLNLPDQILCQVRTVKEELPAAEAAPGPIEPEVIGKKPTEEEAAAGAADQPAAAKKTEKTEAKK
ncbi:MAG TPA: 50S ribosomal protein L25 [Phycisphaerae bacterium]|nr:50S ribosomal protein L25 [Phycisphaerae bacterium]